MALLTTQQITQAGVGPTFVAAAGGGDQVLADDRTYLHVKNASGGAITVTVVTPGTVNGLAIADLTVSVPAAGEREFGPIGPGQFADASLGGNAAITYSGVTSLTVAAKRY